MSEWMNECLNIKWIWKVKQEVIEETESKQKHCHWQVNRQMADLKGHMAVMLKFYEI